MKLSEVKTNVNVIRDADVVHLSHIDSKLPETLIFCDQEKFVRRVNEKKNVSAVIVTPELAPRIDDRLGVATCELPRKAFYQIHEQFVSEHLYPFISRKVEKAETFIHPTATIASNVQIGRNVRIMEHAVVKEESIIEDGCFIDAGAVIGSEGILHYRNEGNLTFVYHAGGVSLGKSVRVLSHAVVARAIHGGTFTTVGANSIVGIRASIGHDAIVGKNCVISGDCLIGGRARIKDDCWVGSACVVRDNLSIGIGANIKIGSVVVKNVKDREVISGNFAYDHGRHMYDFVKKASRK